MAAFKFKVLETLIEMQQSKSKVLEVLREMQQISLKVLEGLIEMQQSKFKVLEVLIEMLIMPKVLEGLRDKQKSRRFREQTEECHGHRVFGRARKYVPCHLMQESM